MTTIPKQRPTLSTTTGAAHARIWGVGGYRPERVVTNDEICEDVDSSDQWIRERTGIITRRRAAPTETVVDMASTAGLEALKSAGLTASQVDAVIVATVTHPYQTPGAAPIVAELDMRHAHLHPITGFDLQADRAGGGLAVRQAFFRSFQAVIHGIARHVH